jgi:hypothetical protein
MPVAKSPKAVVTLVAWALVIVFAATSWSSAVLSAVFRVAASGRVPWVGVGTAVRKASTIFVAWSAVIVLSSTSARSGPTPSGIPRPKKPLTVESAVVIFAAWAAAHTAGAASTAVPAGAGTGVERRGGDVGEELGVGDTRGVRALRRGDADRERDRAHREEGGRAERQCCCTDLHPVSPCSS